MNIHFEVGNLILADALPSTFVFIDQNFTPYDLRLCACRSIVNALNLALQTRSLGGDGSPGISILLLDPHPDLMANAMIRTGSSLFILHEMQRLTSESLTAMFTVVIAALDVLAKISHTASEAIPLLKQKFETCAIEQTATFRDDALYKAAVSVTATIDPVSMDREVLRELEKLAADPFLADQTVGWADHDQRFS